MPTTKLSVPSKVLLVVPGFLLLFVNFKIAMAYLIILFLAVAVIDFRGKKQEKFSH
jgi:hypothetical protein